MIQIAPSLLSANVLQLENDILHVLDAGADALHLDIMDQHYVPNLTFGPLFCAALRQRFPKTVLDVHLMVKPVHQVIKAFAEAGATRIAIHPDACTHLNRELTFIRHFGIQAGLALNPSTSLDCLTYTHQLLDFVLVMTVNPGFGGQTLIPSCIQKIADIKTHYPHLPIAVDGGVNEKTIGALAKNGAEFFVTGSGLFSSNNYEKTICTMKQNAIKPTKL